MEKQKNIMFLRYLMVFQYKRNNKGSKAMYEKEGVVYAGEIPPS
jgi:hypothetical protein